MLLGGYAGKILSADLTDRNISERTLDPDIARKYIGGAGLAARILWSETGSSTEPLSGENRLIFMIGPLTEATIPVSSRYCVAGISPLTGVWGETYSGGSWAHGLKYAGFDGIVLAGQAESPVYLWLHDGQAELRDASHLWGKDTYQVDALLKEETDSRASVACIGQAGERLVRFASIMNDGIAGRAAARCGLGAVMGSKKIKAIVVSGKTRPNIYDREKLRATVGRDLPPAPKDREAYGKRLGGFFDRLWHKGDVVIKNFQGGPLPGFGDALINEVVLAGKSYYCRGCRYSCGESRMVEGGRRSVYEAVAPLGSLCLIDDMDAIQEGFNLCNRYGLDSISTGAVIAFAMEAFDRGLVTQADADGIDLRWGNARAMVQLVEKIGMREGFGTILGEGVRRAAEHIGGLAPEFTVHVKGLEFPGHDPRMHNALALEYATSDRGAHHLDAYSLQLKRFSSSPEYDFPEIRDTPAERFAAKGQAKLIFELQNVMCLFNSLVVCNMLRGSMGSGQIVQPSQLANWLNCMTGWDFDLKEFRKTGERIFNLKRAFNTRRGISRKDDMLPPRIMTHKLRGESEAADNLPPLGEMLSEYYEMRGWTEEGIPTREKLESLDLEWLVDGTEEKLVKDERLLS